MAKVLIASKLPNGLILRHPAPEKHEVTVLIAGLNSSKIVGAPYVTTEVDESFWADWKAVHAKDFTPLKSNAIFEAKSASDVASKAKELAKEKTGLEPMAQDEGGVKPADTE